MNIALFGEERALVGGGITRIQVSDLFGQYSYDLSLDSLQNGTASRLLLFYGNNGSGKTTLLKMIFYLLSPLDKKGHKKQLTKIRFGSFQVQMADGTIVLAARPDYRLKGFEMVVVRDGVTTSATFYTTEDNSDSLSPGLKERVAKLKEHEEMLSKQMKMLEVLEQIGVRAIYTTDKRLTLSTIPRIRRIRRSIERVRAQEVREGAERSSDAVETLEATIYQLRDWAATRTLNSSAQGDDDVNTVYTSMVKRLGDLGGMERSSAEELIDTMVDLERRSESFVALGLAQLFKAEEFIGPLRGLHGAAKESAISILSPYIASQVARLDALEIVRQELTEYLSILRSFLVGKKVYFDVRTGLRIVADKTDEVLSADMLSSGESQLLSIFTAILMATEGANLILVDEPEISLNVEWQRNILEALLQLTQRSGIQFILATHSIELLTRYNDRVLDLASL